MMSNKIVIKTTSELFFLSRLCVKLGFYWMDSCRANMT